MTPPAFQLPDDIESLKAFALSMAEKAARADALEVEVANLKAQTADADERIGRLMQILKAFDRARFGRRSEKLGLHAADNEQQAFVFEEIETGIAAIKAGLKKSHERADGKRPPRPRKGFAPHLERVEVVIEPEELPEHAGRQKVLIGEDVSERLDVVPAKFRVIVTRRPKYAFRNEDGVVQAPAPAHIIESGIPTEALLAQIAVSKYADGLPLYRQEAIYARDKVELDRRLMAQWMGKLGFELEILADYILVEIKKAERVFADETTLPTLAPGSGATKTAWLWAYARDDRPFGGSGPPMVAYRFEDSRSGECVARHLNGYHGILQVDGYAAYNKLARSDGGNDGVTLAGCWSHSRRKFYELHVGKSSEVATATVERMAKLWQVEEAARGQSPDARVAVRQQTSAVIVSELFDLWHKTLPRISGKSKLAEAIRYATTRRAIFERFLSDGRIELDSNIVERAIRPQAITRKNALFAGSDGGGRSWATIATLLQTAKMNNVDPNAWLTQTLERIANGWPSSEIDALMPWNYHA
ncbi:IS66 family transposase [Martelella mediterranea]|uniref:Transposase n=5 Tax=Martelella mediterranea TaxID=293089 RepID=A0A1U9Z7X5_9HYPH|nr:IS66 family transposase [Martelella mediterranea]AQZ51896.1 Transposase [Martelella mediterranea DSM 17316]AQZ53819.1 Transposase [Martelella mediterranea DSM 17316]